MLKLLPELCYALFWTCQVVHTEHLECVKIHVCLNVNEYREHMRKKEQLKVTTVLKSCQKTNVANGPKKLLTRIAKRPQVSQLALFLGT